MQPVCPFVRLSICISVCLYVSSSVFNVSLSVSPFVFMSSLVSALLILSFRLCFHQHISLSVCLVCLFVFTSVLISLPLAYRPSIYFYVCLFICLYIYLPYCPYTSVFPRHDFLSVSPFLRLPYCLSNCLSFIFTRIYQAVCL
jgi:hypothetical protein